MLAIDTNVAIAYFQSNDDGGDLNILHEILIQKKLVLPPPVVSELLSIAKLPKDLADFIGTTPILDPKPGFWKRAGLLRAKLRQSDLKAAMMDCFIAQSCIDYDFPLLTRDVDFKVISKHSDLRLA